MAEVFDRQLSAGGCAACRNTCDEMDFFHFDTYDANPQGDPTKNTSLKHAGDQADRPTGLHHLDSQGEEAGVARACLRRKQKVL